MEPHPPRGRPARSRPVAERRGARVRPGRRAAAWLVTGPVGHAYGGVADWAVLAARWGWARLRGRDPRALG